MVTIVWRPRADPLAPAGLVAGGAVMHAVLRALAQGAHTALSVVATRDLLVVLGPAPDLPWVDGVRYCAPAPDAPGLWLPTPWMPDLPADLVHAALRRRAPHAALLLWNDPDWVLGLDEARPLQPAVLDWLQRELA